MRTFTLDQYKKMALIFSKMPFIEKIRTIKDNSDILTLAADYNWWGVKAKDPLIQEQLEEDECEFNLNNNEWGYEEMRDLIGLLGMEITDI